MDIGQLTTRMPLEHDWQRRPVALRELDFILFGGAHLHNSFTFFHNEGRPGRSVLDLAVGPRKNFLGMLHHFDLRVVDGRERS